MTEAELCLTGLATLRSLPCSVANPAWDLEIAVFEAFSTKVKAFRTKKIHPEEERFGLLDSGATHNVRELKDDEDYQSLIPIEVEVAFNSEVKNTS